MQRRDAHRHGDLVRLRTAADHLPLVVGFDQERRVYHVAFVNDPDHHLVEGRYQIVATYLAGFSRGYINRAGDETNG